MSNVISFEDVTYRHRSDALTMRLNTTLLEGKVTAIIGPSGSGKSTLLQMINGLVRPDSGRVSIFGDPVNYTQLQALRRNIGYMVQGPGLFPHLTIENNIGLASRIKRETVSSRRIDELMERMRLPHQFRQRHPYQLSGGEQQRAAICMALYGKPSILLMDESLGSLDSITRVEIQNQLLALQSEEKYTTVLVTHDLREAFRVGDFLLVLNDGKVEAHGTPGEVRSSSSELIRKLFAYAESGKAKTERS